MLQTDKVIKKGFQLNIITWENDGDNYRASLLEGLIKEDVKFYIDLASRFKCTNYDGDPHKLKDLGNAEITSDKLIEVVKSVYQNHPNLSDLLSRTIEARFEDDIFDFIHEILGQPIEYDYAFCRVFERFEVFYIEEEIVIKNLTEEF